MYDSKNDFLDVKRDYDSLCHAGLKGMTWGKHKYIKKVGDRYYYGQKNIEAAEEAENLKSAIKQKEVAKLTKENKIKENNAKISKLDPYKNRNDSVGQRAAKQIVDLKKQNSTLESEVKMLENEINANKFKLAEKTGERV